MNEIKQRIKFRAEGINQCFIRSIETFPNLLIFHIQYEVLGTPVTRMIEGLTEHLRTSSNEEVKTLFKFSKYKYDWMEHEKNYVKMVVMKCKL